ncbi:MAG: hypothetical protein JXR88_09820 [Clostridia bacterium]|nr:hypothetical protein [Clostridia bacterium]
MKKLGVILLVLIFFLVGCKEEKATGLEADMSGTWLLTERHMTIEFDTDENNYVEFKDTFELPSQLHTRYIRYNAEDEFALDFEKINAPSIYTQTFASSSCDIENYLKSEKTSYIVEYGENEVFYKLDEEKSNKEYFDAYESNGFYNQVSFEDGKMILKLLLTAEDFVDDIDYENVKKIEATMVLEPYEEENQQ